MEIANVRAHNIISGDFFFYIYQLRIGTKSAFEFHNHRSVQISVILSNLKLKVAFKHNKSNQIKSFTSLKRITIKCSKLRLLLCHFNYVRSMKI
jgi:hypothetical protein